MTKSMKHLASFIICLFFIFSAWLSTYEFVWERSFANVLWLWGIPYIYALAYTCPMWPKPPTPDE